MSIINQNGKSIKELLVFELNKLLDQKIDAAQLSIQSAKESRDSDTKSSAGDKYETGRTMMQFELEKNEVQLNKALQLKNELLNIDLEKVFQKVEFGTIVITSQGNYFISIGLGKLSVNNKNYFSISLASPLGKLLHERKAGECFLFQDKEINITSVL